MTFAQPLVLLLIVPVIALAALVRRRSPMVVAGLPGAWGRAVAPPLRGYLARQLSARRFGQVGLCAAIATLLAVALARPLIEAEGGADFANLVGRVIVLDLHAGAEFQEQRLIAERLIDVSPAVPTAIVAIAGEAYTIVPFTTDRRQAERYLQVLSPTLMPVQGRALHAGIAHAEALLSSAGVAIGQIVLTASGEAPQDAVAIARSRSLRAVIAPDRAPQSWQAFAETYDAELAARDELAGIVASLERAVDRFRRRHAPSGYVDLSPWAIGLALVLWLGLFRRRAQS